MTLKNSLKLIADTVSISDPHCQIEGIVSDYFPAKENEYWIYILTDKDKKYPYIQLQVGRNDLRTLNLDKPEYLLGYKIKVIGDVLLYEVGLTFYIKPNCIEILDNNNESYQRDRKWHITNQSLFNKKEQRKIKFSTNPRIGLISHSTTRGHDDFITHLNVILRPYIKSIDIPLTYNEIINAISDLERNCDFICIVSGGGSPKFLSYFSHPKLVKAIFDAKVPIITGVGHQKDVSDSDRVADHNANTPTNAAHFVNERYTAYIKDLEMQNAEKDIKIKTLEAELKILQQPHEVLTYAK